MNTTNLLINFKEHKTYLPKSKITIGNIEIYLEKRFNWFNRLMFKWLFGLDVTLLGDNNVEDTNKD